MSFGVTDVSGVEPDEDNQNAVFRDIGISMMTRCHDGEAALAHAKDFAERLK